ncbi:MAG: tRNA modification GTPase [Pirellulales bacterium]
MYTLDDTIAAIASAPGGAARGIVRLSGPDVPACLAKCVDFGTVGAMGGLPTLAACESPGGTDTSLQTAWPPGPIHPEKCPCCEATRGKGVPCAVSGLFLLPDLAARLPCDVYLWPAGRSYTRQAVAEIHTLGSPPLLEAVLRTLSAAGARLARPGEFTLRAFLAGRIDLTRAEAVLGVIDAADRRELDVALAQLAGGLAQPLDRLRDRLLDLLAELEAGLDFAEEDLEFVSRAELNGQLAQAAVAVSELVARMTGRAESRDAVRIVLVGQPNVGKSSLFNALAGESAALVSHLPGTTRDYLLARLDLEGVPCELIDTAGVDPRAAGGIEGAAQDLAAQHRQDAHICLLCLDATRPLDAWERQELTSPANGRLVALTKIDAIRRNDYAGEATATSSVTGEGLDRLRQQLREAALAAEGSGSVVAGTAARCRESLRLAGECLQRAKELAGAAGGDELIAAEVRLALDELGRVVGAVYTEDILDRIFSRFCIGK